jgi:hypothetical protein
VNGSGLEISIDRTDWEIFKEDYKPIFLKIEREDSFTSLACLKTLD